jgi:ABC-type transporter Mla subunit MlaD
MSKSKKKPANIEALNKLRPRLKQAIAKAAKVRDEIRGLIGEAEAIAESFDDASGYLTDASNSIENAVEEMSKHV